MFGWEAEPAGPISLFRLPGFVGGEPEQPVPRDVVAALQPGAAGPAGWAVDFWIADAEAAAATAERAGGRVLEPPADAGPFRRAVLADPEGAAFSVSQLVRRP
jgi:predicted enzyme related to lactoylglutathione lyase